jgi:iron complex outermembrane recepter protein
MRASRNLLCGSHHKVVIGLVLANAALPLAFAQEAAPAKPRLEEVIVTAQRREENLQQVPIAVSAVSADMLVNSGVTATNAITQLVPSVQFTRSGPSGLFFVRGVGTTNAAAGEEGSNAFYIDDVYLPDLGQTITNFNNIDRIEVLKGPQGTLFGRNAFGGLVHVLTRDPGDRATMKANVSYGNYETLTGQFYAGGPVTDTLGLDIAVTGRDQGEGWGRNLTRGEESKTEDYLGVRGKAVYRPNDALKFTLSGDTYDVKDNTALAWRVADGFLSTGGFGSPGGQNTTANDPALTHLEIWGLSLKIEADLGFATLASITATRKNDNHSYFDSDGGPAPLLRIDYESGSRSFQQELRLSSNSTDPLSWQVGAFYLRSEADNDSGFRGTAFGGVNNGQDINAELITDSYAVFGEATYSITSSTHLTAGVRYTEDSREFDGTVATVVGGVPGTPVSYPRPIDPWTDELKYDEITYRVALRQDLSDDINVYASFNRGFKAGSYSLQSPGSPPVEPMFIDAYEIGLKSELFDQRLRLNAAAFHYNITDYQVRSAATATAGSSVLLNAADVEVDGLDVEFEAAPIDQLSIYGGFTFLDSRYSRFAPPQPAPFIYPRPAVCDAPGTTDPGTSTGAATGGLLTCFGDATGNQTPMAPDFAASLGATYIVPVGAAGEIRLSALYSYNSGVVFEPDEVLHQDAYDLVNASLEYRINSNWGIELWGKNLGDTKWNAQMLSQGTGPIATLSAPRTYGVSFKAEF